MITRKSQQDKWEKLLVPFAPMLSGVLDEGDNLLDLGELAEGEFRGMASVFGEVIDAFLPTVMNRGAFAKTLQERSRSIPILWQHDIDEPIGKPTHLFENDNGLVLQAQISRTTRGRDALILMRDGVVDALSIGFDPVVFDFQEQQDGSMKRFIREARLHEISVVTLGADPNAGISEVRSGGVRGRLTKYWEGADLTDTKEEEILSEPITLIEKLTTFLADYEDAGLSDQAIAEEFAQTLNEAEPVTEPLTLSDVDEQLMAAEILLAEMELG